ncbi:MAG: hypothetical protein IH862_07610 [Chloroflexi bacterium]|nr:hypothetical protein [Chloroflexota bacterium]
MLDQAASAQQDQRLRQLADDAGRKLGRTVILNPLSDLPPNIPARRIRQWFERQHIPYDGPDLLEFDFWDDHQGHHYGVRAIVPRLNNGEEALTGVHGLMSQAQTVTIALQLRLALEEKATKYGPLDVPYVIAVSTETRFRATSQDEVDALFGDRVWNVPQRGPVTETRNPNGFFTSHRDDVPTYDRVSAVLVYRFKWLDEGHEHRIHIYHNPFATKSIAPDSFPISPNLWCRGKRQWGG